MDYTLQALRNARWYWEYTSFGSAINLATDVNGPSAGLDGKNARGIHILSGSGTVTIRMGTDARNIVLTVAAGNDFPGDIAQIVSVSGVTGIQVWW